MLQFLNNPNSSANTSKNNAKKSTEDTYKNQGKALWTQLIFIWVQISYSLKCYTELVSLFFQKELTRPA